MLKGIIEKFEKKFCKTNIPSFSAGDTLQVHCWISEGSKRRLQTFTGAVIAKRNRGLNSSFTLRKQGYGCSVERVFQSHSPIIDSIDVVRRGKVRRAKLYYLRQRTGKASKIKERIILKKSTTAVKTEQTAH